MEKKLLRNQAKLPRSCHAGAKGEKSSYSFLISALDGGGWSASRPPGKGLPVPIG